jgi:chromosome segregation ATPase
MTDEPTLPSAAQIRALMAQNAKLTEHYRAEAMRLEVQVGTLTEQIAAVKAAHARAVEEHTAALTDRDLAHSEQIAALQADNDRLHQTIRDQAQQHLEAVAEAHGHARAAREELAAHVAGVKPSGPPRLMPPDGAATTRSAPEAN